jgi:GT2 family glycosyltransferase
MLALPESFRQPAVSIVLPSYNRAGFLLKAFTSIRVQTWTDWEVIVADNGSTGGSGSIVPERTVQIPYPTEYTHQENNGA